MRYTVFDIEANGLEPTKIYCLSFARILDDKVIESGTIRDYEMMRRFFKYERILVGHNIIRWDIPHTERLLGIKVTAFKIDTLPLSWYLYPEMKKHGLEIWGTIFGVPKPKIANWHNQTLQEYMHRCEEDVKINTQLIIKQIAYIRELYGNRDDSNRIIKYLMFKMDCAQEQEEVRWKLDIKKCQEVLDKFEPELKEREELLVEVMPENVETTEMNVPKKLRTKDGSLSSRGQQWILLLDELGFDRNYIGSIKLEKSREPGNPHSTIQLKDWLFSLGWQPITFKYVKNKKTTKVERIPQISLPFGQGVCPSVKKLYSKEPLLENLENFFVIQHRVGLLKGFLRDVDKDGYLKAEIRGLANTLRFRHTTIVNLPGYTGKGDWKDGVHIRGCLIAPEGHILCGSDMSSLEDRTKQHFMYYFDPEYVKSMIRPDFDPHLDLALFAHKMTAGEMGLSHEDAEYYKDYSEQFGDKQEYDRINGERASFKTVNYAGLYGSGASTMSRTSNMSLDKCKTLIGAYWKKNWSVKKVAKALKVKEVNKQMWVWNPVSEFWYSLRYEKDKFSTLNQGTGVYCFDTWVKHIRKQGLKICGQFHDEIVAPVRRGREKIVSTILTDAINKTNAELKLNRELGIDIKYGSNYAQVH